MNHALLQETWPDSQGSLGNIGALEKLLLNKARKLEKNGQMPIFTWKKDIRKTWKVEAGKASLQKLGKMARWLKNWAQQ